MSLVSKVPPQTQLNNLLEYYQTSRFDDAEKLAISLTKEFPDHQFGWKVLGAILNQSGRILESLYASQKSLKLDPQDADAHNNVGITFKELGRLEDAEKSLRQAIELKPDYAGAYNNLGITLKDLGRLDESELSLRQAIGLKPDYAEALSNLGNTLKELGKLEEAIGSYRQAINIKPDFTKAYFNMGKALKGIYFKKFMPGLPEIICEIFEKKILVRPGDLAKVAISLLKFDPVIKYALKIHYSGDMVPLLQGNILNLSKTPLLLKLMQSCPIPDIELEGLFKNIRSTILLNISSIENNSDILELQIAIASQCFINEYLYDLTEEENKELRILEYSIRDNINNGKQPKPIELLILASYKAFNEYSFCSQITFPVELESLQRMQIIEPKKEKKIKLKLPLLQQVTDKVSCKVREQYEQDPYPRWINLELPLTSKPISSIIKDIELKVTDISINQTKNPKILIAGCGTGQHSIATAARFKDCDVLAVDLSLSSLAYAKRKTDELRLLNIEYMQADILHLGALNRQFDIIESAGVLHHMNDPMEGWRVLADCLKVGGLMKIGLYSDLARKNIAQIRNEIKQTNVGSSTADIKLFRNYIINSDKEHHNLISVTPDFYSMSELRDLLFHVKEHRFTIHKIKECLAQLGLIFCGFESDKILKKFKAQYLSENAAYDLDKWDSFEKENPKEFSNMYQFWCQKIS